MATIDDIHSSVSTHSQLSVNNSGLQAKLDKNNPVENFQSADSINRLFKQGRQPSVYLTEKAKYEKSVISRLIENGIRKHGDMTVISQNNHVQQQYSPMEIERVIMVQSIFRGCRVRKEFAYAWQNAFEFTRRASTEVLEDIKALYLGVTKLFIHLFILVIFCSMVYAQIFSSSLDAETLEEPLLNEFDRIEVRNGYDGHHLDIIPEIYQYLRQAHRDLHTTDPLFDAPEGCQDEETYDQYCGYAERGEFPNFEYLLDCFAYTTNSGYLTTHSRILFTSFITQTRRKPVNCSEVAVVGVSPYRDIDARPCYEDGVLDDEYHSEYYESHPEDLAYAKSLGVLSHVNLNKRTKKFMFPLANGIFNLSPKLGECDLNFMENTHWIDERSEEVCLTMLLSNKNEGGAFVYTEACFELEIGGHVEFTTSASVSHLFSFEDQISGLVLFSIFLCIILGFSIRLAWKFGKRIQKHHRTKGFGSFRSIFQFFTRRRVLILIFDTILLIMYIICAILYVDLLITSDQIHLQPLEISELTFSDAGFEGYYNSIDNLKQLIRQVYIYKVVCATVLLMLVVQTFRYLDFHEEFGVVTRLVANGKSSMIQFITVFVTLVFLFANGTVLLMGETCSAYKTLGTSFNELLFIAFGELEDAKGSFFGDQFSAGRSYGLLISLCFWVFVFLVTILLMNILLTIVISSFVSVQKENYAKKHFRIVTVLKIWFCMICWDIEELVLCCKHKKDKQALHLSDENLSFREGSVRLGVDETNEKTASPALDWLYDLKQDYKTHTSNCYVVRVQLEQLFGVALTEKIINRLRHNSNIDREQLNNAQNRLFKRRAGDIEFSSYKMIQSIYKSTFQD